LKPFNVSITSVRPNLKVDFFKYDEDIEDYIRSEFLDKNKMISRNISLSVDGLEERCVMMFNRAEDYHAFIQDEIIAYQEKIKRRFNMWFRIAVSVNFNEIPLTKNIYNIYQH